MARTKGEIATLLASKKLDQFIKDSTWSDLTGSVGSQPVSERNKLLRMIKEGNTKDAGEQLRKWLINDARARAKTYIDGLLVDDSLTLAELDELL